MRNRAFLLAGLLTLALVVRVSPTPSVEAAPVYKVELIGGMVAWGINQFGQVVGWKTHADGTVHAFLYTDGIGMVDLPPLPDHLNSLARDINDDGIAVGSSWEETIAQPGHAMRWEMVNGVPQVQDLGALQGDNVSEALGINNSGQIVGYSNPNSFLSVHPFLYTDAGGMVDLGAGGLSAYATDINDLGQVAGYGGSHALRWTDGVVEDLGVPEGFIYSTAFAINNSGQVAGSAILPTSDYERIARYTNGTGWQDLGGVGQYNLGWGINQSGDVVGEGRAVIGPLTGVLYTDAIGSLVDINTLIDPISSSGWFVAGAFDINDSGQIVGWGWNTITGKGGALRLTPVGTLLPPAAAPNLIAKTLSNTEIKLTWTDNNNNESGFKIERRQKGETNFILIFSLASPASSYSDSGLQPDTTYEYRVKAFNLAGDSPDSNIASATTNINAPDTESPIVTFVGPPNDSTVSGTVNVRVEGMDNVGVTSLRFYVDEGLMYTANASSLTYGWNTRKVDDGKHLLKAIAVDAAGNVGQQYISVTVKNRKR